MIAELAAANAAFDVIKQTIQNGKEIYDAGQALAQYFGLKEQIQKKAHEHGYKSDFEAWQAAEKLKRMEDELKQILIWQGRPGEWDSWLRFQAEMKKSREQERIQIVKDRLKRKKILVDTIIIGVALTCALGAISTAVWILMEYAR